MVMVSHPGNPRTPRWQDATSNALREDNRREHLDPFIAQGEVKQSHLQGSDEGGLITGAGCLGPDEWPMSSPASL